MSAIGYLMVGFKNSSEPMLLSPFELKYAHMFCSNGFTYSSFSNIGMTTIFESFVLSSGFFQEVIVTEELHDVIIMTVRAARMVK
jgi:hypothetical protein